MNHSINIRILQEQHFAKKVFGNKKYPLNYTFVAKKIEIGKFFNKVYGSPKTKIECVEDFIQSKDINLNRCLFIGDSKSDLQCANHFDMKFLFIKNEYNKHVIVDEDIPQVENFL